MFAWEEELYGDKAYVRAVRKQAAEVRWYDVACVAQGDEAAQAEWYDRSFNRKSHRTRARVAHTFAPGISGGTARRAIGAWRSMPALRYTLCALVGIH